MSLIEVKGLRKSFGSLEVLKGIDLTVEQGERVAIIGGSGCGKSVFLRSLCLLEAPDGGQIFIDGQEINARGADVDTIRRSMGMVFQKFHLFSEMDVMDNLCLAPTRLLKMSVLIYRSGRNAVPDTLVNGYALSAQRRFVYCRMTLDYLSVDGYALSRADNEDVAHFYFVDRYRDLLAIAQYDRAFGRKLYQRAYRARRFALRYSLEQLADGDKGEYHGGRFKPQIVVIAHCHSKIALDISVAHQKYGAHAVYKGCARAECDEGVHIGRCVQKPLYADGEKLAVDDHDRGRQHHLAERIGKRVFAQK
jgi:ABC-type sugar transport system ATPase subunit